VNDEDQILKVVHRGEVCYPRLPC